MADQITCNNTQPNYSSTGFSGRDTVTIGMIEIGSGALNIVKDWNNNTNKKSHDSVRAIADETGFFIERAGETKQASSTIKARFCLLSSAAVATMGLVTAICTLASRMYIPE